MLARLHAALTRQLRTRTPWGPAYALARTVLAAATLGTLLCNEAHVLFRPAAGQDQFPVCRDVGAYGLFCQGAELDVLRWVAIVGLALVMSGWRPRLTGVLHWWIAASLNLNATVVDGGEQVAAVLTLLLVPVTLTDPRRNHWHPCPSYEEQPRPYARLVALVALLLITVQVCFIYAHASIAKFGVAQWSNGTAMYYWLTSGNFSAPQWLRPLVVPLVSNGFVLTLLTWSVLLLEYMLGAAPMMPRGPRVVLFWSGVAMHVGILVVQGIASFAVTMLAALILAVWPHPERSPVHDLRRGLSRVSGPLRARWAALRSRERVEPVACRIQT